MKKTFVLAIAMIGLLAFTAPSQAQNIVWGSAQGMAGDSDVSTSGTYFDAATFYLSGATVNGVVFNPLVSTSGTLNSYSPVYSDGLITANSPGNSPGAYGSPFTTTPPSSTAYSDLTSVIAFGYFQNGTVSISGLTDNDLYQVQVWSWYPNAGANAEPTLTGSNTVTLNDQVGQFAIGTFTATSSTETFNYDYGTQYGVINAVSVRDITAVPEPSTIGLLGLGLFGLAIFKRKRLAAAFQRRTLSFRTFSVSQRRLETPFSRRTSA